MRLRCDRLVTVILQIRVGKRHTQGFFAFRREELELNWLSHKTECCRLPFLFLLWCTFLHLVWHKGSATKDNSSYCSVKKTSGVFWRGLGAVTEEHFMTGTIRRQSNPISNGSAMKSTFCKGNISDAFVLGYSIQSNATAPTSSSTHKREDGGKSLQGLLLLLYPSPWNELDLDLKTSSKNLLVIRPQD